MDKIKIGQGPHPYGAKDVQNRPLVIIGYAEYFLVNGNNFVRRVEVAMVKQGGYDDVIINLDTLKRMGVMDKEFPSQPLNHVHPPF